MERTHISHRGQVFETLSFNSQHPGTAVILVHGLLSSVYTWYPKQLEFLYRFGPVHSIALPAHAPSTTPRDWHQVDESVILDAMEAQIDRLAGDGPVVLIGHSTGGNAALIYALAHPDRVKGVVTIGTAHSGKEEGGVYGFVQWSNRYLGPLGGWLVHGLLWLNALSPGLHKQFLKDIAADPRKFLAHPDLDDYVASYFPVQKEVDRKAMVSYFRDMAAIDLADRLRTLQVPVLVMCGDRDPYVSRARTDYLLSCLPQGQACIIRDCGHAPMFEQPDVYEQSVSRFIDSALARKRAGTVSSSSPAS